MRAPIVFVVRREILSEWNGEVPSTADAVDAAQHRFRRGENNWIVQTYALLREELERRGFRPLLQSEFLPGAIAIAHWDALNAFWSGAHRCRVIGVRADRPPLHGCDRVIVQNNIAPDTASIRFIPHWPQPGLLPRDPGRGARVENIAYLGRAAGAVPWMTSDNFGKQLAKLGVNLRLADSGWEDYRNLDAILSVRPESPAMLESKPASKLTNAWLAGVPALVGVEPAFEALRRSELDFMRIGSAGDAIACIERLKNDPARYLAMIRNGRERSREFTRQAIAERWLGVIDELGSQSRRSEASWSHYARSLIRQKIDSFHWRRLHDQAIRHRAQ